MGMCWQKIHDLREIQCTGHRPETQYEVSQKRGGPYQAVESEKQRAHQGPLCLQSIDLTSTAKTQRCLSRARISIPSGSCGCRLWSLPLRPCEGFCTPSTDVLCG